MARLLCAEQNIQAVHSHNCVKRAGVLRVNINSRSEPDKAGMHPKAYQFCRDGILTIIEFDAVLVHNFVKLSNACRILVETDVKHIRCHITRKELQQCSWCGSHEAQASFMKCQSISFF